MIMEKKQYISPIMDVISMHAAISIMDGSPGMTLPNAPAPEKLF